MTVFRQFETGDRAAVEVPSGNIRAGRVVDTDQTASLEQGAAQLVTVQVAENVRLQVPASDASPP